MEKNCRNNKKGIEDNAIQSIIVHEDKIRTVFTVITEYCIYFNRFRLLHCLIFTVFCTVSPNSRFLLWLNLLGV